MTKDQLERFRKEVEKECDGEITEEKLAQFISTYNWGQHSHKIYIEGNTISTVPLMMGAEMKSTFKDEESKIDAMLMAMGFVMVNSRGTNFTYSTGGFTWG